MIEAIFSSSSSEISKTLMDVAAARHKVLAGNLANVHTPGYKRIDFSESFVSELESAVRLQDSSSLLELSKPDFEVAKGWAAQSPDGNNVNLESEMVLMAKNALEYEANAQFLSNSLRRLKLAITGRN